MTPGSQSDTLEVRYRRGQGRSQSATGAAITRIRPLSHDPTPQDDGTGGTVAELGRLNRSPAGARAIESQMSVAVGRFDPLVLIGLRSVLSGDPTIKLIGEDVPDPVLGELVARRSPEVLLLDEGSAVRLALLTRLRAIQSGIALVVLSSRPTRRYEMQLAAAGARCILKASSPAEIITAVHCAAQGTETMPAEPLTPREHDVLERLRAGSWYAEIADDLDVGIETVRTHAARIRRKLGVQRSRELIGMPALRSTPLAGGLHARSGRVLARHHPLG